MTQNIHISQNEIKEMLIQFHNATGIRVGVHDPNMEILSEYPVKSQNFDEMSFCDVMRTLSPTMAEKCRNCDLRALEQVKTLKHTYVYKCHAGFTEAIIPILSHGELISVLMMGQISATKLKDSDFYRIVSQTKEIDPDLCDPIMRKILLTSFDGIKQMELKQFSAFAYLLEMCAQSIYDNRWIRCEEKTIIEDFKEFVKKNIYNDISISDAAQALKISRSHLSRIIQNEEKTNFTNYVLDRKIEVAQKLLETTTMSVKEIAAELKFNEPTYFMRVFKNKTGQTCSAYRKSTVKVPF